MKFSPARPDAPPPASRIALGTAQFGLDYGVSNPSGQVGLEEARHVLDFARSAGCDTLDTAIAYGDSEARLGTLGVGGWRVVSKLPAFAEGTADLTAWARAQVMSSLARLDVAGLDTLLLHAPAQLASGRGDELFGALCRLRDEGLVRRLGVSIYSPAELDALIPHFAIDVVQAPHNVLDRSLQTSGWAERLVERGIEVHLRSAFLQGLLLMAPEDRPAYFSQWQPLWTLWDAWLEDNSLSALQACVRHALGQEWADKVIVGVTSAGQLRNIIEASQGTIPLLPQALRCDEPRLINPSLWKVQ